ncbi:MAG: hypothetical protein Q4C53_00770 [Clostridia bacterium]|nr:hypothetical protein [Clostridia bacterium]
MKESKQAIKVWLLALLLVAAVALLFPFARTAVFYVALGADAVMFALCAVAFYLAFGKAQGLQSKLIGWPLYRVGCAALAAQLVAGLLLMAFSKLCPLWLALIIEIALVLGTLMALSVKQAVREAVEKSEQRVKDTTAGWKAIRTAVNALAAKTKDPAAKRLAEAVRCADPTPTSMDGRIAEAVEKGDVAEALRMVEERKTVAKAEKK